MIFEGRCWKFGDNIPTDRLGKSQDVSEPMEVMAKHVLEDLNPDFPVQVRPGDIVVAGQHLDPAARLTRGGCDQVRGHRAVPDRE